MDIHDEKCSLIPTLITDYFLEAQKYMLKSKTDTLQFSNSFLNVQRIFKMLTIFNEKLTSKNLCTKWEAKTVTNS